MSHKPRLEFHFCSFIHVSYNTNIPLSVYVPSNFQRFQWETLQNHFIDKQKQVWLELWPISRVNTWKPADCTDFDINELKCIACCIKKVSLLWSTREKSLFENVYSDWWCYFAQWLATLQPPLYIQHCGLDQMIRPQCICSSALMKLDLKAQFDEVSGGSSCRLFCVVQQQELGEHLAIAGLNVLWQAGGKKKRQKKEKNKTLELKPPNLDLFLSFFLQK